MLRRKIASFILAHPVAQDPRVIRTILLYALGRRTSEDIRVLGREREITEPLYRLKSEFLDRSYYMASLFWRVAFAYFKRLPVEHPGNTREHHIDAAIDSVPMVGRLRLGKLVAEDIRLFEAFLTPQDHQHIGRVARAAHFSSPDDLDLVPVLNELQSYCRWLARRKMSFIANNDVALTLDDLSIELFEASLSTLLRYDADIDTEPLKVLNYAKRGAHNHCIRLIEFHTAKRRARLVRIGKPQQHDTQLCGTCAWFDTRGQDGKTCATLGMQASYRPCRTGRTYHARVLTDERVCGNCQLYTECARDNRAPYDEPCGEFVLAAATEYFPTTTSLDRTSPNGTVPLGDLISAEEAPSDAATFEWLQYIEHNVSPDIRRVVNITVGQPDESFDQWVWAKHHRPTREFTDRQLARMACDFVGVRFQDVRDCLIPILHPVSVKRA